MAENNSTDYDSLDKSEAFAKQIERRQIRKLQSRESISDFWVSFTSFGVLGWTIVVPTLLGIALGIWLDHNFPGTKSWTLMLMTAGLFLGCFNGWRWIEEERARLEKEEQIAKELAEQKLLDEDTQAEGEID